MNTINFGKKPKGKPSPITPKERKRINTRWKRFEDWAFKMTGWKRRGHILRGVSCSDLENELFSLDVTTSAIPAKVEKEMTDAEFHKKPTQVALVWFAPAESKDFKRGIAVMRISDFLDLLVGEKKNADK